MTPIEEYDSTACHDVTASPTATNNYSSNSVDRLKALINEHIEQSKNYSAIMDLSKTRAKRDFYRKKLKKNNKHIVGLMERLNMKTQIHQQLKKLRENNS